MDGDNLEEGEITIVLPNEKIAVDSETVFTDVTAEYEITMEALRQTCPAKLICISLLIWRPSSKFCQRT